MTIQRIHDIMKNELRCVQRNELKECDRDCSKCDLLMDTDEIIQAYNDVLKILERIKNLKQYESPYPSIDKIFKNWWKE